MLRQLLNLAKTDLVVALNSFVTLNPKKLKNAMLKIEPIWARASVGLAPIWYKPSSASSNTPLGLLLKPGAGMKYIGIKSKPKTSIPNKPVKFKLYFAAKYINRIKYLKSLTSKETSFQSKNK